MEDCCDEDLPKPPHQGGQRKPASQNESFAISENAKKKLQGEPKKKVALKQTALQELEEKKREEERVIQETHDKAWYLDDDYLNELQERIDTCFKLHPPDPIIVRLVKCYQDNRKDPMQCQSYVDILHGRVSLDSERFVERLKNYKKPEEEQDKKKS